MIVQIVVFLSIFAIPISALYLIRSIIKHRAPKDKMFVSAAVMVLSVLCVVLFHLPIRVFSDTKDTRFVQVELGEKDITLNNAEEVAELFSNMRGYRVLGGFATYGCVDQDVRIWLIDDKNGDSWMLYAPEDGVRFLQKSSPRICVKIMDDDVFYAELLELIQQNIS